MYSKCISKKFVVTAEDMPLDMDRLKDGVESQILQFVDSIRNHYVQPTVAFCSLEL